MKRVALLYRIEVLKLLRQRLALTTFALPVAIAALLPQLQWFFGDVGSQPERGFFVLARSVELSLLAGCYLLMLQASMSVVVERHDKTLRNLLITPVRRGEVIFSRWFALQSIAFVFLLLLSAVSALSTAVHFEFGDVYEEAIEPLAEAGELRAYTLIGLSHLILPLAALISVGVLVSVITNSPATAASLALGSLFFLDIVKAIFPRHDTLQLYLFNSYLPTLFDRSSYWHGVTAYAQGITDILWMADAPEQSYGMFVPLATVAVCFCLSIFVFAKRDYKG